MEREAFRVDDARVHWPSRPNASARLLQRVLAAFDTACDMEQAGLATGLAERLLALVEDIPGGADAGSGDGPPHLERLVEARFRLLEVKYDRRHGGALTG